MSSHHEDSQFATVWDRDGPRVAAYARRHVPPGDVDDVVAETFLQAWRRWPTVPRPPIAWLIGTARKVVGNHRRAAGRREALRGRLELRAVALPAAVRTDSHGYGDAFPEVDRPVDVSLTFVDDAGRVLGTRPIVVPGTRRR